MSANPIETIGKQIIGGALGPIGGILAGVDAAKTGMNEIQAGVQNDLKSKTAGVGAPPTTPTIDDAATNKAVTAAAGAERRRSTKGRAANLLTGAGGITTAASTTGRTLLGS